jgi:hypothetical protein
MNIVGVLKLEAGVNARLSVGDSWLVWDETYMQWVVYRQQRGQRVKYYDSSLDEAKACRLLLEAAGFDVADVPQVPTPPGADI